jgi:predicted dehydrogenase
MKRREFLKTAAAGTAGIYFSSSTAQAAKSPIRKGKIIKGRKLNIAQVGISGKGYSDLKGVSGENIVAICDVDFSKDEAGKVAKEYPNAKRYQDYRKMLLEMDEQIDAVGVATPDHMHYPVAKMAIEMGKHVYVQKPLTHTVWEARQLRLLAKKHNVITQMGNQGHAGEGCRITKEWIQAGVIGDVREVHIWTPKLNRVKHAKYRTLLSQRPSEKAKVPKTLDWNLWLGVAPERPYSPEYHPKKWRSWWDFGCGVLGDIGCHTMDGAFYALELGAPQWVSAETSEFNDEVAPDSSLVTYSFAARGDMPPVKLYWYDGGRLPERPKELEEGRRMPELGAMYVGDKGVILDGTEKCQSPRLIPESKMSEMRDKLPAESIARVPQGNPHLEWVNAIKGGPMTGSNFEYSGPLSEMVLLGNVAIRVGKKIQWDPKTLSCSNAPEADKYIRLPHRKF